MAATHVFVELSRAISCYNIAITLQNLPATLNVRLTPTPECLYLQVTETLVLVIPLAAQVTNTDAVVMELKDAVLSMRLPCNVEPSDASFLVPQFSLNGSVLNCRYCGTQLAKGLEQIYELPELDWEELSELWNCHPSHHQSNPLILEETRYSLSSCFISKFHAIVHPSSTSSLQILGESPSTTLTSYLPVSCSHCSHPIGEVKITNSSPRQFSLQLNRINTNWSLTALIIRQLAMLPEYDYRRTLAISTYTDRKAVLVTVSAKSAMILRDGKYREAIKCLYEVGDGGESGVVRICGEDWDEVLKDLKERNRRLPVSMRKIGQKRLVYFVYSDIFP